MSENRLGKQNKGQKLQTWAEHYQPSRLACSQGKAFHVGSSSLQLLHLGLECVPLSPDLRKLLQQGVLRDFGALSHAAGKEHISRKAMRCR